MGLKGLDCEGRLTHWPDGYSFGLFRCIRESGAVDADYAANVRTARAAGAVAGAYHYLGHGRPIRDDVKRLVDAIGDPAGLLVSPDVEDAGLTWAEIETWFDEWRKHHPAHPVLLYSYRTFWNANYPGRNGAALTPYMWAANPRTGIYLGDNAAGWSYAYGGWPGPDIWQYRGTHSIGVGASIDANAFRGTLAELRLLTRPLPDTGADMNIISQTIKGEDWKAIGSNGVFRDVPDRAAPVVDRVPIDTIVRSITEVITSAAAPNNNWRLTERNGRALYMLRSDWAPLVPGGDPATDAALTTYIARLSPDCSEQVAAATLPLRSELQAVTARLETANGRLRQIRANVGTEDV